MDQQQQIVNEQRGKIMNTMREWKGSTGMVDWERLLWIEKLNERTLKPLLEPLVYGADTVKNLADLFCDPTGLRHDSRWQMSVFNVLTAILFVELGRDESNACDVPTLCIDKNLRSQRMLHAIEVGPPASVWIEEEYAQSWKSGAERLLSSVQRREDLSEEERDLCREAENKLCGLDLSLTSFVWGLPGSKWYD